MMLNLKPVYDAAVAAEAKVNGIMAEMITAFEEGTDEGKQKAMDMREALESARAEAKTANDLYLSMREAQSDADEHARLFVPVSEDAGKMAGTGKKTITRAQYEAMPHSERGKYLKDGGMIVDEIAE